jgi:ribosomal protein L12E/L44/L45/RPP1/RPP2
MACAPPLAPQKGGRPNAQMKEVYKRMSLIVPPELHRAFKTACALEGVEMTEVLLEAIRQFVAKHPNAAALPKKRGRK